MRRLIHLIGHRGDEIARVDITGGTAETIRLEDNQVRKVRLQLSKGGVSVEMTLSPAEAEELRTDLLETIQWTTGKTEADAR